MKKTFYYARVSSTNQNLARQIEAFKKYSCDFDERNLITDKISGKDLKRPGYQTLKGQLLRRGDTLVIESLNRLSRNKKDIKEEVEFFKMNGIRLKILDLPSTLIDPTDRSSEWIIDMINNIIIEVLASFAEQERNNIRKNQRQGIDAAKKAGVKFGRPVIEYPENWEKVYRAWKSKEIKAVEAMRILELKHTTFYKLVRKYENSL